MHLTNRLLSISILATAAVAVPVSYLTSPGTGFDSDAVSIPTKNRWRIYSIREQMWYNNPSISFRLTDPQHLSQVPMFEPMDTRKQQRISSTTPPPPEIICYSDGPMAGFMSCQGDQAEGISFFFEGWSVPDEYIRGQTVLTVQRQWMDQECLDNHAEKDDGREHYEDKTDFIKEDGYGVVPDSLGVDAQRQEYTWYTHERTKRSGSESKTKRDSHNDCSRVAQGSIELPHGDFWQVPGWGQSTHPEELWVDWYLI